MCMEPSKFTPDNLYHRSCHSDSEDPAVENDCAAGCHGGSYDSDKGKRYYCGCEASSAADCAAKNPGEEHATAMGCCWSACDEAHGRRRAKSKAAWL